MPTLFQQHVERWRACTRCDLCHVRFKVVHARGDLPATILFCGEAPGDSEDICGAPFKGPAGYLLEDIKREVWRITGLTPTCFHVNLVGCLPKDNGKKTEPTASQITTCSPRLRELVDMAQPRLVVYVGDLAEMWFPRLVKFSGKTCHIHHPARILRSPLMQQGFMRRQNIVTLVTALEDL